jgi:ABC-type sugar transport system ATPase subunit
VLQTFQVADPIVALRHGRVTGERPVRWTISEEIVSLITGEFGDLVPVEPPEEPAVSGVSQGKTHHSNARWNGNLPPIVGGAFRREPWSRGRVPPSPR